MFPACSEAQGIILRQLVPTRVASQGGFSRVFQIGKTEGNLVNAFSRYHPKQTEKQPKYGCAFALNNGRNFDRPAKRGQQQTPKSPANPGENTSTYILYSAKAKTRLPAFLFFRFASAEWGHYLANVHFRGVRNNPSAFVVRQLMPRTCQSSVYDTFENRTPPKKNYQTILLSGGPERRRVALKTNLCHGFSTNAGSCLEDTHVGAGVFIPVARAAAVLRSHHQLKRAIFMERRDAGVMADGSETVISSANPSPKRFRKRYPPHRQGRAGSPKYPSGDNVVLRGRRVPACERSIESGSHTGMCADSWHKRAIFRYVVGKEGYAPKSKI